MVASGDLINYGLTLRGKPYVFGAEGPNAFDCSGLMQYVFGHFGIRLPRVTGDQVKVGSAVSKGFQKPGDLVFSSWDGKPHSHVGMYIGDNKILVAPKPGDVVKVQSLNENYLRHVDAIRRIPGIDGGPSTADKVVQGITENPVTAAAARTAQSLENIAASIGSIGKVAEWIMRLSIPSVATRVVSGVFGTILLIMGIIFVSREAMK